MRLYSDIEDVFNHINLLYSDYPLLTSSDFFDIHVSVMKSKGIRRWYNPQAIFSFDDYRPFLPLPINQASAFFEWGLNWAISNSAHHYLIFHAAILEKNGCCLVMPGTPGSGKSTLCAALVCNGWRLFSDEMALLSINDGLMYPAPRPVSLKNNSIEIIKNFSSGVCFGGVITNTSKGDISHMRVPVSSINLQDIPAKSNLLVFPHFKASSTSKITKMPKTQAFMALAENAFNFNVLGDIAFDLMAHMMDNFSCFDFVYPDLKSALNGIESLV